MEQPVAGLYSGSAKPHASVAEAAAHVCSPIQRIASASLRRLEPELPEVLRLELLLAVNIMPTTVAPNPEVELRTPPAPLLTDELIPKQMQRRLHAHRLQVAACFSQARKGRWKWARAQVSPAHCNQSGGAAAGRQRLEMRVQAQYAQMASNCAVALAGGAAGNRSQHFKPYGMDGGYRSA